MAVYAAMVEQMDRGVGKILDELDHRGMAKDTLVLFLSDTGGCAEGGTLGSNKGKGECGTGDSFVYYGECWANASNRAS